MIPTSYRAATLRCVLPVDPSCGQIAFALEAEGETHRFSIAVNDALALADLIGCYAEPTCQPASSSGSPNCDGSPHDGQNV